VQVPVPASVPHPGHRVHPTDVEHCEHDVNAGVPEHVGATLNACGGGGSLIALDLQQICPVQSLFVSHCFGHVVRHVPLQQSWPVVLQSAEVWHDLGHGSICGFKHSPPAFRLLSTALTDVQQISPRLV
jgi:hypothetical protein